MRCRFVVCHFKCSSSLKSTGFWLAVNVFIIHQVEKNIQNNKHSISKSNDIVPGCCYRYSCNVDFFLQLDWLLKLLWLWMSLNIMALCLITVLSLSILTRNDRLQLWIELHWLSCYRDCVYFNSVNNRSAFLRKQSLIYTCTKPITGRPSVGGSYSASRDGWRWMDVRVSAGIAVKYWLCLGQDQTGEILPMNITFYRLHGSQWKIHSSFSHRHII